MATLCSGAQYLPPSRHVPPPEFCPINDMSVIAAVANNTFMTGANRNPPSFFTHQQPNVPMEEPAIGWARQPLFRDLHNPSEEAIRTNLFAAPALEGRWFCRKCEVFLRHFFWNRGFLARLAGTLNVSSFQ